VSLGLPPRQERSPDSWNLGESPPRGDRGSDGRVPLPAHPRVGLTERELAGVTEEPLTRRGQREEMELAPVEEDVGQEVGAAVEEAPRRVLLGVGDELEEERPAASLPVPLHLDAEHLLPRALPEQIDPAMLEPRVVLDIVNPAARHVREEKRADQLHRPARRVLHCLHAVGARHGLTFQRAVAAV